MRMAQLLYGAQLEHYVTPQEAAAKEYFGGLYADYNKAAAQLADLDARNDPMDMRPSGWFGSGKSNRDKVMDLMNQKQRAIADALRSYAGVTEKAIPPPAGVGEGR